MLHRRRPVAQYDVVGVLDVLQQRRRPWTLGQDRGDPVTGESGLVSVLGCGLQHRLADLSSHGPREVRRHGTVHPVVVGDVDQTEVQVVTLSELGGVLDGTVTVRGTVDADDNCLRGGGHLDVPVSGGWVSRIQAPAEAACGCRVVRRLARGPRSLVRDRACQGLACPEGASRLEETQDVLRVSGTLDSQPVVYWRAMATRSRSSGLMRWSTSSASAPRSIWTQLTVPVKVLVWPV